MDYVILNYSEIRLLNLAIIFGKNNLKLEDFNKDFKIYTYYHNDSKIYLPVLNKDFGFRFKLGAERILFNHFDYLKELTKIIVLPSLPDSDVLSFFNGDKFIHLVFQGDPFSEVYSENIKVVSSTKYFKKENVLSDIKLCLPFFFYKHQISLVDFNQLVYCENKFPLDKIFVYERRADETSPILRHRGYFVNKIKSYFSDDKIETSNLLHKDIELETISMGKYHLGNFFDYQKCMFNIVFESQHVDYKNEAQTWISEKTLFAILFANPFFLLANEDILNALKELGIDILNDEFDADDIGDKFDNFCMFMINSTLEERKELFEKYKQKQIENRKKLLEYINSPKKEIIEFIIN